MQGLCSWYSTGPHFLSLCRHLPNSPPRAPSPSPSQISASWVSEAPYTSVILPSQHAHPGCLPPPSSNRWELKEVGRQDQGATRGSPLPPHVSRRRCSPSSQAGRDLPRGPGRSKLGGHCSPALPPWAGSMVGRRQQEAVPEEVSALSALLSPPGMEVSCRPPSSGGLSHAWGHAV